jgi:mannitol operon transcriptional antiterminator
LTLQKEKGKGLWVEGAEIQKEACRDYLQRINGYELILSSEKRQHILLFYLLLNDEHSTAKDLGEKLGVSRSTLFSDLDKAALWLQEREIEMTRRPGFGIQLSGKENDIRQALVDTIVNHIGKENLLYTLYGGGQNISSSNPVLNPIAPSPIVTFLNSLQTSHAYQMITEIEEKIHIQFTDYSTMQLILHTCILIVRIARNKPTEIPIKRLNKLTSHPYFETVSSGLVDLGEKINISFSFVEKAYLLSKLLTMEIYDDTLETAAYKIDEAQILDLISESLVEVDDLIGNPRLSENSQVVQELAMIFRPLLERWHLTSNLQNPLLEEFQCNYPELYHAAKIISLNLAKESGNDISKADVGYIGMYLYLAIKKINAYPKIRILVICTMGAVTSHLLAKRLQSEFPQLEIVGVMGIRQFLANPTVEADAIITTEVNFQVHTYLPVFHVHPLLNDENIQQIKTWLLEKETNKNLGGNYKKINHK